MRKVAICDSRAKIFRIWLGLQMMISLSKCLSRPPLLVRFASRNANNFSFCRAHSASKPHEHSTNGVGEFKMVQKPRLPLLIMYIQYRRIIIVLETCTNPEH
jgi:hypothetical protein